jgi:hypothetical protein
MQWSDVVAPPPTKMLRQFAGLFLVVFLGLAAWRVWQGHADTWAAVLAGSALLVGVVGLAWPPAIRYLYTGWMIVAFPIGWTISHLVLALMFYGLFAPVAAVFRLIGRDELRLRRKRSPDSYWTPKPGAARARDYFRQF